MTQFLVYFAEFITHNPKYVVDVDPQFVIPLMYFIPLVVCVMLRKFAPKHILASVFGIMFTVCFTYFTYVLYLDYAIWKFVMPVIVVLGGLSGLSGWFRLLLKKIKDIGNDDSYLR